MPASSDPLRQGSIVSGERGLRMLCESEIQQLYSGLRDKDIARFQIPMSDSFCVRSIKRVCDLDGHRQRLGQWQRAGNGLALDVLHDEVVRAYVIECAYVRVIQGGDGMRFACESLRESGPRELDGDCTVQTRVTRFPHLAHATGTDRCEQFVWTESLACFQSLSGHSPSTRPPARGRLRHTVSEE